MVRYGDRRNILRIVNVGAYAGVEFSILRAELVLYAVDGGNEVSGRRARSIGHPQPGERVDVLIEPSTRTGSPKSILHVFLDATPFKYPNSSLTSTHEFPVMWKNRASRLRKDTEKPVDRFELHTVKAATSQAQTLPNTADEVIVLYSITRSLRISTTYRVVLSTICPGSHKDHHLHHSQQ